MSIYERILAQADANRANHHHRLSDLCRAHFARHPERAGGLDIEARCSRLWWRSSGMWQDDSPSTVARHTETITLAMLDRATRKRMATKREIWQSEAVGVLMEALDDLRQASPHDEPLCVIQARSGRTMTWLQLDERRRVWIEGPVKHGA
ncbi:hypothetical protein HC928_01425 [bacterium]|nr:hypothetical protein [bacterium]